MPRKHWRASYSSNNECNDGQMVRTDHLERKQRGCSGEPPSSPMLVQPFLLADTHVQVRDTNIPRILGHLDCHLRPGSKYTQVNG